MRFSSLNRAQRAGVALALLLLISVALVIGLIVSAARGQDRIAAEKSIELVRAALAMRETNTAVSVKDYAWWTEAVRHLVDAPDAAWAYEHIGRTTYESIGVTLVTVIDASGRQTFTFVKGEPATLDVSPTNAVGVEILLAAARAAPPLEPIPVTGMTKIGGQVFAVALAALTVASHEDLRADEKPRSVLMFGRALDAPAIAALAADHRIAGLRLVESGAAGGRTSYPLTTADGVRLAELAWTAERPGNVMIRQMLPPVGATILGLALLSAIILWQIREVERARRENQRNLEVIEAKNRDLILARDEAEQATRVKSQFLAVMSHELRTPLNAIIGFSEVIHSELYGPLGDGRYKQYLQDIRSSGDHLLSIINDILDLSKIEAGRWELQEEEINVGRLLTSVRTLIKGRVSQAGLSFTCEAESGLPTLRADRRALMQILLNLLSNAVKFTPRGGRVGLRVEFSPERGFSFVVSDTGIGIAAKDIARAMTAFGQVDDSWSRRYEGAGLGLPISRALVRLHGGTLDLASEPGAGTIVTVRMPRERTGTAPVPEPETPPQETARAADAVAPAVADAEPRPTLRRGLA
jgi:signal transduction histidine kinase